ncbi:MAG: hypothetical protein QM597_01945 [Aeromicrobium sp.]|uniref:hypothetical protein n=1 Tax=Aeromicrobium sp. TaxID=1871063 RepID=UPI0039E32550
MSDVPPPLYPRYPATPAAPVPWGYPWPVAPLPPQLPGATTALVLGIVALAGGLVLVVPLAVAPLAWYLGAKASRLAEREPGRWRGAGSARTAMVLGMVGSALLAMLTIFAVVVITLMWVAMLTPSPY